MCDGYLYIIHFVMNSGKSIYRAVARALAAIAALSLGGPLLADTGEAARLIAAGEHRQALEQLPEEATSRRARLLRAEALLGLGRESEAERIFLALIEESPEDPVPYNNLAAHYAADGRLREASELLSRAMKSDSRYAAVYKNLSRVYVEMSRNSYAKALRMSEQPKGLQLLSLGPSEVTELPELVAVQQQPEPPAEPQQTVAQAGSGEEAVAALRRWAAAWSAQDVEGYLAAYDEAFEPRRGNSLEAWQQERRRRLLKPGTIEVALSDIEASPRGASEVKVRAVQAYRSDNYRDTTRKGFIMVRRDGGWKIRDEYTIEVLN